MNRHASVTWGDLQPGGIVRYEHLSRARRLADKPLTVRRGRIERVVPPPGTVDGQITITVLNKDGTPNGRLGRITLHGLDQVVSVTLPEGGPTHA